MDYRLFWKDHSIVQGGGGGGGSKVKCSIFINTLPGFQILVDNGGCCMYPLL